MSYTSLNYPATYISPEQCRGNMGNVLFIILIAVALFGALSAAVTRSTGTVSPETLTQGQAQVYASEIMQFGIAIEQAVNRLLTLKGCEETQISFDYDIPNVTGYENANAPSDYSCHVFHVNGGGVSYLPISPDWLDGLGGPVAYYNRPLFILTCIKGVGTTYTTGNCSTAPNALNHSEIVYAVAFIKKEICEAIALKLMGTESIPADDTNAFWDRPFQGSFDTTTSNIDFIAADDKYNSGYPAGCLTGNGAGGATAMPAGRYAYYQAVLSR